MARSSSLPAQLALGLTVLAATLVIFLWHVHKASYFSTVQTTERGAFSNLPDNAQKFDVKSHASNREMLQEGGEDTPALEEQVEEERGSMNIVLFYADDWRHDVSSILCNLSYYYYYY